MKTKELYFKYIKYWGGEDCLKVKGYAFQGKQYIEDFGEGDIPEGKIRILKCKCGANNWTDNGENINDYECDCCGQFITVY